MYQVMWTTEIWLGIRWNYHTQAQLKWRSLCAPLDIVPLLPLTFFSIFGLSLFFWDSLTFYFYFFDIFSSLRITKEVTIENMSLNKWKVWPVENSEDVLKIDKKLVTTKIGSCDQFLKKNQIFWTQQSWISILSTRLSCWPIHVPSTRCIKWFEQQKYY